MIVIDNWCLTGSTDKELAVQSYWLGTLKNDKIVDARRKHGTISNLKEVPRDMGYLSSSRYMREQVLGERHRSADNDTRKSGKLSSSATQQQQHSVEEVEDELRSVKKQANALSTENSQLQARVRRLLEENKQKDAELLELIEQQAEAQRALQSDKSMSGKLASKSVIDLRKAQSTSLINSLKVKIGELQAELDQSKAQVKHIQDDLKTTSIRDLRIQCEVYYNELQRLRNLVPSEFAFEQMDLKPSSGNSQSQSKKSVKERDERIEALQTMVEAINRDKVQLQADKSDLRKRVGKLEKQLEQERLRCERLKALDDDDDVVTGRRKRAEQKGEREQQTLSADSNDSYKRGAAKIDLDRFLNVTDEQDREHISPKGSVEERLAQYEKRESQLLSQLRKRDKMLAELVRYAKQLQTDKLKLEKQISSLEQQTEQLQVQASKYRKQQRKDKVLTELNADGKAGSNSKSKRRARRSITSSLSGTDDDNASDSDNDDDDRRTQSSGDELARGLQAQLRGNAARNKALQDSPEHRRRSGSASSRSRSRSRSRSGKGGASGSESDSDDDRDRDRQNKGDSSNSGTGSQNSPQHASGSRSASPSNKSEKSNVSKVQSTDSRRSSIQSNNTVASKKKSSFLICGGCTSVVSPRRDDS